MAVRLDGAGLLHAARQRLAEAVDAWTRAEAAHRQAGDPLAALVCQARRIAIGVPVAEPPDGDDGTPDDSPAYLAGLAELREVTGRLVAAGDQAQQVSARLRLTTVLVRGRRLAEALAELDESTVDSVVDPLLPAEVANRRAHLLMMLQRRADAIPAAIFARERFVEAYAQVGGVGEPPVAAVSCLVLGHAMAEEGRYTEAVDAFAAAVGCVRLPDADRGIRLAALIGRGRALRATGRPVEAIHDLVEVVAEHIAQGEDLAAGQVRFELATAYHDTGQSLDAAESAEAAVDALDRAGLQDLADRARYLLSRVYRDLQEPDRALELLELLAVNLDGFDNVAARGQMYEEAGQILYQADRDATAAERYALAADAYATAGLPLDELRARRMRAMSLRWAGDPDVAVAALAEADQRYATLPPEVRAQPEAVWEQAMLGYDAARVYIGAERLGDALDRIQPVAAAFRGIDAYAEALHAEVLHGELLLRSGHPDAAEPVLRVLLGQAPHDSPQREQAAVLLCEVLDALGREPEAERLRAAIEDGSPY